MLVLIMSVLRRKVLKVLFASEEQKTKSSLSLSSVCGSFFVALFFLRVVRTRSERVRDGSLHFSPLEQQRKEF